MRTAPAILLLLIGAACARGSDAPTAPTLGGDALAYVPAEQWRHAAGRDLAVDERILGDLIERIRAGAFGVQHSLMIVKNGWVITEEYFNAWPADTIHTMQSVTKSVASLAAGIAIVHGDLKGTSDTVYRLFPTYAPLKNLDAWKMRMTVRDILTMRTGLDWWEDPYEGSPLQQLNSTFTDWIRFVVDWPMREAAGSRWVYNSGGVIALGGAIQVASRVNAADYTRRYLFRPIGITDDKWVRGSPQSLPHFGGGLYVTTRDLARIGYLVLRNGRWGNVQVVPEAWIRESTRLQVANPRTFSAHQVDYGYLWWLLPLDGAAGRDRPADELIIAAIGAQGQHLFVVPKYDLVVVTTADIRSGNESVAIDFLYDEILRAVR
jgi:CubicO group peptidase (beta-lactamase class C family)